MVAKGLLVLNVKPCVVSTERLATDPVRLIYDDVEPWERVSHPTPDMPSPLESAIGSGAATHLYHHHATTGRN
jgi:hypothetical protein